MNTAIIYQQIINGLVLGSIYGLIAIGYSLVYGIIGMINFAHGDVYMVSAYLTAIALALLTFFGIHLLPIVFILTLVFTVSMTALYGWSIERIAYRPLRQSTRLAPLISAIGMSLILQNYVRISQGAHSQGVPLLLSGTEKLNINEMTVQLSHIQILILVITFVSTIILTRLIQKTHIGRCMRAIQQDMEMASILGVNLNKIIPAVFVLGAMMAAVAGVLVTIYFGSFDFYVGFIIGMKAFTAAVLGGIGSLLGAMLGGLILGLAESLFSGFVNVDYKDVFSFGILILVLIFKPYGILGTKDVEKI